MRQSILLLAFAAIFASCGNKAATTTTDTNASTTTPSTATATPTPTVSKDIQPLQDQAILLGKWAYAHEPFANEFKADGTYIEYTNLIEGVGIDFSKPSAQGTWTFANGKITTKVKDGGYTNTPVFTKGADYIFIGDLDEEYDEVMGTKEEYFLEFGYVRIK